ncbi:histidine phosphatase family protein [Mariniflexile ostreae]|uniref:Histidine phosphatase family protein n=1 Tax=Mariniflexile ostreae TaxID=1520892 RepID=A0ABV5F837_9FLAO
MKTLIIVRHAKSSWDYDVIDHERPLAPRGESDAKLVSEDLKLKLSPPDLILCSDAKRTRATAHIFLKNLNFNEDAMLLNHDLYDFAGYNFLEVIKSCNNSVNTLMVFGHNHAITDFVNTFGDKPVENVPTSGTIILEFDIAKWNDLKPGKMLLSVFPRDLKS